MTEIERKMRRSKYGKTYYQKHREACIERAKAWYNAHKEYRRLYMLAYNGKQYFYMDELYKIKELNTQYKLLRNNGMVVELKLLTNIGIYSIKNPNVISKVLDLLIRESQKQIESEVNK